MLGERLTQCEDQRQWHHAADHVPILTEFDLSVAQAPEIRRRQWSATNWETFIGIIKDRPWPLTPLHTHDDINLAVTHLVDSLLEAAKEATPEVRVTGFTRPGYTPEMTDLKRKVKQARRRARETDSEEQWEYFRQLRHQLGRESAKSARNLHRQRIEVGTQSTEDFWKAARWARCRGAARPSFTPTLRYGDREFESPKEKARILREVLHPKPPEADLSDITKDYTYPNPISTPQITKWEAKRAIDRVSPNKAPGPDGLPNLVLQRVFPIIGLYLTNLFNECLRQGYCPSHFRKSITVVLRKPGKADYTDPKSYRPIALLSTIGKALEAILANRISYLVEKNRLLPPKHIGGRKGRSCEHAIHLLLEQIHASWRNGDTVASLLTLDVSGAFDNVNHQRLLHNLRCRSVPQDIVNYIGSFLTNRRTTITLLEGPMGEFVIDTGIPQGSPLSPILYLFFNADLITDIECTFNNQVMVTAYIDDICILTWSKSAANNCQTLARAHKVAELWESRHASKFSPGKYHLIHMFSKHRSVPQPDGPTDTPLVLRGVEIKPEKVVKYLGVWLDSNLTGVEQAQKARKKAATLQAALASIAGSTWGATTLQLRRMYIAVLLPQITYACSTWYIRGGHGFKGATNEVHRTMESIQYQTLHRIAGAFRTTSRAALEICLHIPPPQVTLARMAEEACLRLLTSPLREELHAVRRNSEEIGRATAPLASPLHRLEHILEEKLGTLQQIETIHPFIVPPWWEAPETSIEDTREKALRAHKEALRSPNGIVAYTDGSATDGGIGAAVVSNLGTRRFQIGTPDTHTVYAAELTGIDEALGQLLAYQPNLPSKVMTIYTDNQATIHALQDPGVPSGQYILQRIITKVDCLRSMGWHLCLRWLPGHEGAKGNELADTAAKEAARRASITFTQREPHMGTPPAAQPAARYILAASCRQRLRAGFAAQWQDSWNTNPHGAQTRRIFSAPSKAVLALHSGLKRAASSIVVQLQTGKIALAAYLGTFGAMDSVDCTCTLGRQTVEHILTACPLHETHRNNILWASGRETDYRRILSQASSVRKAAQFMVATRLLGQFWRLPQAYKVTTAEP
jgi:ribonuclease HI